MKMIRHTALLVVQTISVMLLVVLVVVALLWLSGSFDPKPCDYDTTAACGP